MTRTEARVRRIRRANPAALPGRRLAAAVLPALLLLAPRPAAGQGQGPTLHLVEDADRREILLEIRGLDLPASAGHHEVIQPAAQTVTVPVSGWLHGYRVEVVDGQGRAVPQQVVHHVNVIATDRRELFSNIMLRIAAAGQETAPVRLPRMIGLPIRKGQRVLVTAALHNPTPRAYGNVTLRLAMPYTPASTRLRPISAYPLYLDVMPPAGQHAYDLPPGRSEKSWEGRPAIPGRILGLGGHLHTYGVALRLEDVTAGKVIWEARPIVDERGEVVGMPTKKFFWRLGVPLRADHVYRLTAVYDNPTGKTIPDGAMGALGGVFLPARSRAWPAIDRAHPEYLLDLRTTTEGSYGHGGHGGQAGHGSHGGHDDGPK